MLTSERFNWLVMLTFTAGVITFILSETVFADRCGPWHDKMLIWRAELDSGMNNNWSGWHVDIEEYIKECYGEQALIDMDLR